MSDLRAKRQLRDRILIRRSLQATVLVSCLVPATGGAALSPEAVEYFESKIRPVLAQDCYECHRTGGKKKAGLALDHRTALLEGGDSGPAIVPGDPDKSLLMVAIRHEDEDLEMPKSRAKLEDEIIADFTKWIEMGAPDPRDEPSSDEEIAKDTDWKAVMERRKSWWSFQPIVKPELPNGEAAHPVDRFIEAGIVKAGLQAAGPADRRTLIRRLSFALRGLPPSPEESEAFVNDASEDAYEKLVDRYLASPQFGERWARHWMDWLRYADSHGSEGDPDIPDAWQYRDYLIRALNADVPYDQLVREHVAGDLLEQPRLREGRNESAHGTGHLRMVFHGFAPTDALDEQVRFTDDQISVLTKAFLGLTVSCARCHDHKFDAISQKDYYALYGILASTKPGMVTVNAPGLEDERRRARMAGLKDRVKGKVTEQWLKSAEELAQTLSMPEGERIEKAGNPNHVLYPVQVAATQPGKPEELKKAIGAWQGKRDELQAHREREYMHDWNVAESDRGTTHGPSARNRVAAGEFALSLGEERVIEGIYPAGVYSHLVSSKDPGVVLSPRMMLHSKSELWARVIGREDAMIRYSVQNYPRSGTVYPTGRLKNGNWKWQKWSLDYWTGDHIHLEVTTGPDQAILRNNKERSWIGVREVLIVKRGEPAPPGELLDWVEPLLGAMEHSEPTDADSVAKAYATAVREAVASWQKGEASDGQAMLLQELMANGLLPNNASEIAGVQPLLEEYRKLEGEIKVPTRVPGVWEADSFDQPLFERGNHKKPLTEVPRRFLEAIDSEPYRTKGSGRRELAEDMLRSDNPFTARVIANRLWHHLFGRGIVSTTDNFGRLGTKPTHPELLDDLATRMVENGWSIKKVIRHLVTSETWKRSSVPPAGAREKDPGNELLSHFRVKRLEAEAIRDSLLAVTGELDDKMYGGPITGGTPRRSVYMRIKRNALDPFLSAFDAPVPASTVGRRDVTNVPAQSLTMLNSDFVIGLAERWAGRAEGSEAARAKRMFTLAMGRSPSEGELANALEFVKTMAERRNSAGGERRRIEEELKEIEIKLAELSDEAKERVLAVRGVKKPEVAAAGPAPIAHWDFEGNGEDRIGKMHVKLHGDAKIVDGALKVGGKGGFASTAPLRQPLLAKTLEAWVQLDTLDQKGGGVMTVQTPDGRDFDSIVYSEKQPRRWLAGSENHKRTTPFEGPEEDAAQSGPVHVAITYAEDGTVIGYRQGQPYGKAIKPGLKGFAAGNANVLFGCRHGKPDGSRQLHGRILEARLYDRALTAEEIVASASKDTNFISEKDLLAAMSEAARKEREDLMEEQKELDARLASSVKPGRPNNEWADYAHALFNSKEFIYIR